jgi:PhnB protein
MATTLNPYLSFRDDARSAMDFYQSVFGGELTRSTFAEAGMSEDPGEADKVMHSQLVTPGGMVLMGADTPASMEHTPRRDLGVPQRDRRRRAARLLGGAVRRRHRRASPGEGPVG